MARIEVVGIGAGSISSELNAKLCRFNLSDAHCYNPNDERKIKSAIAAGPGGPEKFTKLIRELGHKLQEKQEAQAQPAEERGSVVIL